MKQDMRYTAISRTTKKEFINVFDDGIKYPITNNIDIKKIKEKKKREQNLKNNLKRKQIEAIRVINYIVRKGCSDEYSLKHTHLKRCEL